MTIEQFKTDEIVLSNINQDSIPRQVVMQGEKDGRSLTVQVTNGGVVEPQAGLNLNLGWKHRSAKDKNGNLIQGLDAFQPIDRENGIFRIEYTSSMAQTGTIDAEIQFVTSTSITKSQPFIITVKPSTVDESAVESESSFTVLQEALTHVSQYDEKIEGLEISKADRKKVEELEINKADKDQITRVEDMVSKMPTATPRETFVSLSALQAKYPNGSTSAMVVLESDGETGYVYLWDGSSWKRGALYQSQGIADGEVTAPKIKEKTIIHGNLADKEVIFPRHLVDASIVEDLNLTDTVTLNEGNTKLISGKLYHNTGKLIDSTDYSTLIYEIGKYLSFTISNYTIGVYGGAFLADDYVWIESFRTDAENGKVPKICPATAKYIAISARNNSLYSTISADYVSSNYKLDRLIIDSEKLEDYEKVPDSVVTIALNPDNTDRIEKIYSTQGNLADSTDYCTLIYEVGSYSSFTLTNYMIGVYGGAFLDADQAWIVSFRTDSENAYVPKVVPKNGRYIAITARKSNPYQSISGTLPESKYYLKNLVVDFDPPDSTKNIWYDKKIAWLGTSVPFGSNATKSYAHEASQRLSFNLVNTSVPGLAIHTEQDGSMLPYGSTTLSISEYAAQGISIATKPILPYVPGGQYNNHYRTWENIFIEENADVDLWVFDVVPNNSNFGMTDWDNFDKKNWVYKDNSGFGDHRKSFIGALLFLMDKMYSLNSKARMCFVLGSNFNYLNGKDILKKISEEWNIPIIDIWGKVNTSPKSLQQLKSKDGTDNHPSTYAHEILGKMIAQELLGIS